MVAAVYDGSRVRGWGLAALGMLMVSTDSYFIRRADFDSWTIAFVFGLASALTLGVGFLVTSDRSAFEAVRGATRPFVAIAVLASISQIAFTAAVNNTAVSNVVVIVAATPLFAAIVAWLVLGEPTDRRVQIAIAIVVVGVLLVVSGSLGTPTLGGDLFALVAISIFAITVVIWRKHPEIDRPLALAASSVVMAAVALPNASLGDAPLRVFVAAGLMGLIFNPIGRVAYSSAPRYAPASEVALFAPVETVTATAWAWMFFDETPTGRTVVGGTIVIAAVMWGTIGRTSPDKALRKAVES